MRNRTFLVLAVILFSVVIAKAETWITIPGAAHGISGNVVAGSNSIYDMTTQTTTHLVFPGASSINIAGIDGNNIVGRYTDDPYQPSHSFIYDGTDWKTLTLPTISPSGISGDNICGGNWVYNMTTQTAATFNFPGAIGTSIHDIDGENIVGGYISSDRHYHGFLYDGTSWTGLDAGLPDLAFTRTSLYGISGNYAIGFGTDSSNNSHGLLYDIVNQRWTVLDYPDAIETHPTGIDGNKIVGTYETENNKGYSFLYTFRLPTISPVADAGADVVADANQIIVLNAGASYDPDGHIIEYTWTVLPEDDVLYSGTEITCAIKALGRVEEIIKLTVTDDKGASSEDTISIFSKRVENIELTPGPTGAQGLPGITPAEIIAIQEQIIALQQERAELLQQIALLQQTVEHNSYLLEQLPQLQRKNP